MKRSLVLVAGLLLGQAAAADPKELVILLDDSTEMPQAEISGTRVWRGIHHDLGRALAKELGKRPRFLVLPRQRIPAALASGQADLICMYLPAWLPGPFDWTQPFLPNADVVITSRHAIRPRRIAALAGQPIGTILGFRYPELEARLGPRFVRDDAPNASSNLHKLQAGRTRHAVVNRLYLSYQEKLGLDAATLYPPLVLRRYQAGCALSRQGSVSLPQVDAAIDALRRNDTVSRIYRKYR